MLVSTMMSSPIHAGRRETVAIGVTPNLEIRTVAQRMSEHRAGVKHPVHGVAVRPERVSRGSVSRLPTEQDRE